MILASTLNCPLQLVWNPSLRLTAIGRVLRQVETAAAGFQGHV